MQQKKKWFYFWNQEVQLGTIRDDDIMRGEDQELVPHCDISFRLTIIGARMFCMQDSMDGTTTIVYVIIMGKLSEGCDVTGQRQRLRFSMTGGRCFADGNIPRARPFFSLQRKTGTIGWYRTTIPQHHALLIIISTAISITTSVY